MEPIPHDRGDEHGDVDGFLECSLAQGVVAAVTRAKVAEQRAANHLSWERLDEAETSSDHRTEYDTRYRRVFAFSSGRSTHVTGV